MIRTLDRAAGKASNDGDDNARPRRGGADRLARGVPGAAGNDAAPRRSGELHGGRFLFGSAYFSALRRDGGARFYAEDCTDLRTNRTLHNAFVAIAPDGTWDAAEIPMRQWEDVGFTKVPEGVFEDSRGGVWVGGTLRTRPNLELEPAAPDGLYFDEDDIQFEDAAGRVCAAKAFFTSSIPRPRKQRPTCPPSTCWSTSRSTCCRASAKDGARTSTTRSRSSSGSGPTARSPRSAKLGSLRLLVGGAAEGRGGGKARLEGR